MLLTPDNNTARYTATAIAFHWLTALLVIAGFSLGLYMVGLSLSPQKLKLFSYHKWIGVTVFLIVLLRLSWRLGHTVPDLPNSTPPWQRHAARAVHSALYVVLLLTPLCGWLYSSAAGVQVVYFGLLPLPDLIAKNKLLAELLKEIHGILAYGLAALVGMHVLAALKHHFIEHDDVLARMLPFIRRKGR